MPRAEPADDREVQLVLGRALKELRHRAGLSQEEVADRLGIDPTYVSQVERGRRGVRWVTALRFARALDVRLVELAEAVERQESAS